MKNYSVAGKRCLAAALCLLLALSMTFPAFATDGADPAHTHVPADNPVWNWAEDYSACTVTFTCADCGKTFTQDAVVTKEWQGEGPDQNGEGRYYFTAGTVVNERAYWDFTNVFETEHYKTPNPCPLDGIDHGDTFWGKLTLFFHKIFYYFAHLFDSNRFGN